MPRRGKDFYRGISFQPPAAVAAAARRPWIGGSSSRPLSGA
jgi:hypothetical protein